MTAKNWQTEYRKQLAEIVAAQRESLVALGLTGKELDRAMEPLLAYQAAVEEQVPA